MEIQNSKINSMNKVEKTNEEDEKKQLNADENEDKSVFETMTDKERIEYNSAHIIEHYSNISDGTTIKVPINANIIEEDTPTIEDGVKEVGSGLEKIISGIGKAIGTFVDGLKSEKPEFGYGIKIVGDGITYKATKPETQEYKDHDEYMAKKSAEYDKNHPAPEKPNPITGTLSSSFKYDKWQCDKQKYMDSLETTYREDNPEYKKQAEEYEQASKRAGIMM